MPDPNLTPPPSGLRHDSALGVWGEPRGRVLLPSSRGIFVANQGVKSD